MGRPNYDRPKETSWEALDLYRQWLRAGSDKTRGLPFPITPIHGHPIDLSTIMSDSSLVYIEGDLFTAPDNSILVHACNTLGSWGSGIALTFRQNYPAQFAQYKAHCVTHGQALVGTCLLIPGDKHDIACLFTSRAYGRRKDKPAEILAATRKALIDLEAKNIYKKALHAWSVNY